ncbi:poly(R)-hydroxyalkanoic acid synthase, class I [Caballeronia arvi]|uniref:Poly(R)-hydroxyalkanoic acid synthase, class I n=1 Tax=Caballeronia arvi TaxID=1777135 RepID=A0A158KL70_9BURK|nr:poly(R)-hydroxyalkanoic acid synthase, class I [Caballeronia arvi]
MPFSMPHEFAMGWARAGLDFWRASPAMNRFGTTMLAPNDRGSIPGSSGAQSILMRAGTQYVQQQTELWSSAIEGMIGARPGLKSVAEPEHGDRRFHGEEWSDNGWYSLLKQSYLLNARMLGDLVEGSALNDKDKQKLRFFMRQFLDLASPANFAATNPEAIREAVESRGLSLLAGLTHLLEDLKDGAISITDQSAFEVGRSVATSSGAVVYENELFQLIQYAPLTPEVARRPLVIVPPCINKLYILDLQPENSFVRFASEQGLTVFIVSWRNAQQDLAHTDWDAYLEHGDEDDRGRSYHH